MLISRVLPYCKYKLLDQEHPNDMQMQVAEHEMRSKQRSKASSSSKCCSNTLHKRNDKLSQDMLTQQEEQEYGQNDLAALRNSISTSQYDQHTKLYLLIDITVCDT